MIIKLFIKKKGKKIKDGYNKTIEDIQNIVNIRASLNNGLSEALKEAFPNIVPGVKPLIVNQGTPAPEWLAGFTTGEGCFSVKIRKGSTKIGFRVELAFVLTQHTRDEELLISLISYFGCGSYYKQANSDYGRFRYDNFRDISEKLLPFLKNIMSEV